MKKWRLKNWVIYALFIIPFIAYLITIAITKDFDTSVLVGVVLSIISLAIIHLTGSIN